MDPYEEYLSSSCDEENEQAVEVLFEFGGSRKELFLRPSTACERIQEEIRCLGYTKAVVNLSVLCSKEDDFLLQRWCKKWDTFVDVECVEQIVNKDRLTVVRNPVSHAVSSPQVTVMQEY